MCDFVCLVCGVGHYDNLPCAAPFKGLQGLVFRCYFCYLKWHCKPLLIAL